ncbi:MutS-related protein [Ancylomarina sp. YFZ004]
MQNIQPADFYNANVSKFNSRIKKIKKQIFFLSLFRLFSFVTFVAFIALYIFHKQTNLFLAVSFIAFVSFLYVVQRDLRLAAESKLLANKLRLNQNEIKFLNYEFDQQQTGSNYANLNPHLAADFDLFGAGSLYQYLNRCFTKIGKDRFANSLCQSELDEDVIIKKQEAIKELCEKNKFVQNFQAHAMLISETGKELSNLQAWLDEPVAKLRFLQISSIICPLISLSWLAAVAFGPFTLGSLLLPILINMLIVGANKKLINDSHAHLGKSSSVLKKYTALIKLTESESFESPYLNAIKKKLSDQDTKASLVLKSLFNLLNTFDLRYNWVVSLTLNALFLFDVQILFRLIKWKELHKESIPTWFPVLSELEPLMSYAVFAYNNQSQITYPQISNEDFSFRANEIGHPLLASSLRVNNTINIKNTPCVNIITGANMAGKSTFLRTMTVNLILAMNGAPVCAKKLVFSPCEIMSSIKIQDSLSNNESYFYAELLRIKEIISHVEKQPRTLVILDEILRGTNTKDKQLGSLGLLEKLISLNAVVMIATHDLLIGKLEDKYPLCVTNNCFEVELTDDQLIFDYKLKQGISQKLNASFLMKKMGIMD